jgi:hypothetical protein
MENRHSAIQKIEAWARWEMGNEPAKLPGVGASMSPGFVPSDQADHMTVEVALKDYAARREGGAQGLRALLLHVYGFDGFPDSFDAFGVVADPRAKSLVRSFLGSYGWAADAFVHACVRRFIRFLGRRL